MVRVSDGAQIIGIARSASPFKCCKPDPLHGRVCVLEPVPECPGEGIDDDPVIRNTSLPEQDVELLCKVYIDW